MRSRKQHTIKLPMGTHLCHSTLSASGDRRDLLGCMQHELKFERTRELSCLEVCFLPNFTSPLSSFNFSSVAFLQPAEEIQTIMGISPNHSSFQSFAEICRGITSRLPMCSLCLVCESKGDVDFTSQEQTSKGLVMRGSMEVTASDLSSPCQYFNITAALIADPVKEDNTTCTPETRPGKASAVDEDLARKKSLNHTCRFMKSTNNCAHIFLRLETDVKPVTCSMKITWYILVLLVFMLSIIFIIHKILEDHRKVRRWQSHKYKSTSGLLRGGGSVKLSTLSMRVIPESTQRLPLVRVMEELPPIPELEVASAAHQQDQYTP
ncbi:transmembrane protein 156 isoform X2 [Mus musculus]|uniref:Transmembrane protein 156 n=1 Tax=Mus musculus TaxID=10090 RepID=A0A1D5RLR8_MOUSE|nr:transmembrane protein 156 isoform X2 [Mus musculus]|eukprot:XP_017176700.1 PREDICTED: transmembrane protein 156 isoform X2 [Mus musculus]